tara:strand:+ start:351 stop:542 length:192 start_codon:yes stop_codon:yes gene_type:complete
MEIGGKVLMPIMGIHMLLVSVLAFYHPANTGMRHLLSDVDVSGLFFFWPTVAMAKCLLSDNHR